MNAANRAWYWLAAGVLALGLNGYYQDGGFQGLHRLAGCTRLSLAQTRGQFSEMATLAQFALRDQAPRGRKIPAVVALSPVELPPDAPARLVQFEDQVGTVQAARVRAQVERLQEGMVRREMQQALLQAQKEQMAVLTDRGRVRMALPRLPRMEISVPPVQVQVTPN